MSTDLQSMQLCQHALLVPATDESVDGMIEMAKAVKNAIVRSSGATLASILSDADTIFADPQFSNLASGAHMMRLKLMQQEGNREELIASMCAACDSYLEAARGAGDAIVNYVLPFIRDTSVVIAHGCGAALVNCIASCLMTRRGVRFLIAEGRPQCSGRLVVERLRMHPRTITLEEQLRDAFEPFFARSVTVVPDSSLAMLMSDSDLVLVGANAVTEHGGLAHSTGSLQLAIVAEAMSKPFYVLSETFKFTAIFPLSTRDLYKDCGNRRMRSALSASLLPEVETPDPKAPLPKAASRTDQYDGFPQMALWPVELVPPRYIALIICEEGIMPPSAVADQMLAMKLKDRHESNRSVTSPYKPSGMKFAPN